MEFEVVDYDESAVAVEMHYRNPASRKMVEDEVTRRAAKRLGNDVPMLDGAWTVASWGDEGVQTRRYRVHGSIVRPRRLPRLLGFLRGK